MGPSTATADCDANWQDEQNLALTEGRKKQIYIAIIHATHLPETTPGSASIVLKSNIEPKS